MLKRAVVTAFAILPFPIAAIAQSGSDVAKSWEKAIVYVGGSARAGGVTKVNLSKPAGVVLFIHGCAGIGPPEHDAQRWAALISKQGFTVVLPDSMARSDRQVSCDPIAKKGGLFPPLHGMRLEEIRFAAEQIRKQPWFDGKNLFLMGYSEGAIAAVRSKLEGFRGVVATSWSCTNAKAPDFDGVFTPPGTPLLTLMHVDDPWFQAPHLKGSCATKIADRKNAKHITVPGTGHGTYDNAAARNAVVAFVKANAVAP